MDASRKTIQADTCQFCTSCKFFSFLFQFIFKTLIKLKFCKVDSQKNIYNWLSNVNNIKLKEKNLKIIKLVNKIVYFLVFIWRRKSGYPHEAFNNNLSLSLLMLRSFVSRVDKTLESIYSTYCILWFHDLSTPNSFVILTFISFFFFLILFLPINLILFFFYSNKQKLTKDKI